MDNKYIMRKIPMRRRKLVFTPTGYEPAPNIKPNYVVCRTSEDRGAIKSVNTNDQQVIQIFKMNDSSCTADGFNSGTGNFPCHDYYITEDDYRIQVSRPALDRLKSLQEDSNFGVFPNTSLLNKAEVSDAANVLNTGNIIGMTFLNPETALVRSVSSTYSLLDAKMRVTFKAPPTTNVMIETSFFRDSVNSNVNLYGRIVDDSGNVLSEKKLSRADETDDFIVNYTEVIQDLTADQEYAYNLEFKQDGTLNISYGGTYPAFIVKAIAIPATLLT